MDYVYTIASEDEIRDSFFENLRRYKVVDSAIYYLDEGANSYYEIAGSNTELHENKNYFTLLQKNVENIDSLVSLGCGNSMREKTIITDLLENEKQISPIEYVGVDTSITMLNLSMQYLKNFDIQKKLICADFSSQKLRKDLLERFDEKKCNVFTFLGATMGNLGVEYSMDLLSDITTSGDYLLFDIRVRQEKSILEDRRLYEYYRDNYANDVENNDNIFSALYPFGITKENGDIGLEMTQSDSLNSLQAKLKYFVQKPINSVYKDRHLCLTNGDEITLKTYMAVDKEALQKYFKARGFEFIDFIEENEFGYFLFQKN